ncbi:B12-binding domain-containing radical SAM protein [bacterium]|nr:B12-binding domain-containing radical SAM protein [bacterium]
MKVIMPKRKIKRVVLTYPNQRWYKYDLTTTWNLSPYSLCILAAMIQDRYEVKIIDAQFYNMSKGQFKKEIQEFRPDCVGISILTSEYETIVGTAADIIKKVDKNIVTIAGGVHVTTQYKKVMDNKNIDYAVRGEGEYVLGELLDYLSGEGKFPSKGVVFRGEGGQLTALPPDIIQDLDVLPPPNYDLVDYRAYANTGPRYGVDSVHDYPYARILTSRGCPVGCSFCQVESISGKKWRPRSVENVVNEIELLKKKYGIQSFIFEDDNPFYQKTRTKNLFRLLKERDLNLKWKAAGVAIFMMDEEIFKLMAETGCQMIGVAVESGTQRILKEIIKKPVNLKKVPQTIKLAQKYGIFVAANFVIGFPGETWEEIRQTLHFAETCGADYCKIYPANPLVGTKMFAKAKELGCIIGDETKVDWRYGRIKTSNFSPKDIAILRVYEWDRINFSNPEKISKTAAIMGMTVERLNEIRKNTRENLTFEDIGNF